MDTYRVVLVYLSENTQPGNGAALGNGAGAPVYNIIVIGSNDKEMIK